MKEVLIDQNVMQRASYKRAINLARSSQSGDFLLSLLRQRLLDALGDIALQPRNVIEFGCANGILLHELNKLYPGSKTVGVDLIAEMLALCDPSLNLEHGDAEAPSAADNTYDLIVSNALMPMLSDPFFIAAQWLRVMQENGTVCFTTLGPDSFKELKAAFLSAGDSLPHVHPFYDMHDICDAWRAAGAKDVVAHAEKQVVLYKKPQHVLKDMQQAGFVNACVDRRRGLTGKNMWQSMLNKYPRDDAGMCVLTLEVVVVLVRNKACI